MKKTDTLITMHNWKNEKVCTPVKYISRNIISVMTVAELIEILSEQDKETPIYILDDNDMRRPVFDIGIQDDKIVIIDF